MTTSREEAASDDRVKILPNSKFQMKTFLLFCATCLLLPLTACEHRHHHHHEHDLDRVHGHAAVSVETSTVRY